MKTFLKSGSTEQQSFNAWRLSFFSKIFRRFNETNEKDDVVGLEETEKKIYDDMKSNAFRGETITGIVNSTSKAQINKLITGWLKSELISTVEKERLEKIVDSRRPVKILREHIIERSQGDIVYGVIAIVNFYPKIWGKSAVFYIFRQFKLQRPVTVRYEPTVHCDSHRLLCPIKIDLGYVNGEKIPQHVTEAILNTVRRNSLKEFLRENAQFLDAVREKAIKLKAHLPKSITKKIEEIERAGFDLTKLIRHDPFNLIDRQEDEARERTGSMDWSKITDKNCVAYMHKQNPFFGRFYTDEEIDMICEKFDQWTIKTATTPEEIAFALRPVFTPEQRAYVDSVRKCKTLRECLKGGDQESTFDRTSALAQTPERVVRKEMRLMTNQEKKVFFETLNLIKTTKIGGSSKFDLLVKDHYFERAPAAHRSCAFLPFHREFLKTLEIGMRQINSLVALPYWDSSLDQSLPRPCDSVLWTDDFIGNNQKYLVSGPYKDWSTVDSWIADSDKRIYRECRTNRNLQGYTKDDFEEYEKFTEFSDMCICKGGTRFEGDHGLVHSLVGGHMSDIRRSPNDPVFFMHHAFVDYLWEHFRQTKQNRQQRETDYPAQGCNAYDNPDNVLLPFDMKVIDGMSNNYTDEFYEYQQRPTCENGLCKGEFLVCDTKNNQCMSKIGKNGNCRGFDNLNICHKSKCVNGRCV